MHWRYCSLPLTHRDGDKNYFMIKLDYIFLLEYLIFPPFSFLPALPLSLSHSVVWRRTWVLTNVWHVLCCPLGLLLTWTVRRCTRLWRPFSLRRWMAYIWMLVRSSQLGNDIYRQFSNIRCTLVGNKIVDHSDVVGASPVGAAPTTSSFPT